MGFKKINLCVYLEFGNGFGNDTVGNAIFGTLVYSEQDGLDEVHSEKPKNRTGGR